MENINKLNKAETSRRIGKMLQDGVNEIVIHGENKKDSEGKDILSLRPDLDSRAAIYLMELAKIDYNHLTFVPKGDWVEGSLNIDTGEEDGPLITDNGTVFLDHHGPHRAEKGRATSATEIVYDILLREKFLKEEKYLNNLVDFVTDIDNADYPLDREYFMKDWWRSLYGLQKAISFESLVNIIKSGKNPREPFSTEEAKSATVEMANKKRANLSEVCDNQRRMVDNSIKGVLDARKEMESSGIKNYEPKLFGSVLFNLVKAPEDNAKKPKNKILLGFTAARGLGFDSYFLWDEKTGGFFITSKFHLQRVFDIVSKFCPNAKIIRGTMIVNQVDGLKSDSNRISADELLTELGLKK
ncbi:MAG TPA: hypothetical protein PKA60_03060 [Candidatus Paceibacterota bacterium]|nr:hypothetical protein [Candidatus Paceibacterota bacterium]